MWLRLLLLLSLAVKFTGESDVIGSHEPIEVEVGQDAVLPCHLVPPFDVRFIEVEWTYILPSNATEIWVHMYRNEGDDSSPQDKKFKKRTSLFHEHIAQGIISLKLTNVTKEDAGNYSCSVPRLSEFKNDSLVQTSYVILIVKPKTAPNTKEDTNNPGDAADGKNNPSTLNDGAIAGIVVGGVALLAACLAIFLYKKKICRNNNPRPNNPNGDLQLEPVNIEENQNLNPAPQNTVRGDANVGEDTPLAAEGQGQ